jgi:hypothetical protein
LFFFDWVEIENACKNFNAIERRRAIHCCRFVR